MVRNLFPFLFSALLLFGGCAAPVPEKGVTLAPAARPAYRVGDRFVYRTEKGEEAVREVEAVADGVVRWRTEKGFRFAKRDPFLPMIAFEGARSRGRAVAVAVEGDLWPLAPGRRSRIRLDYVKTDRQGRERRYREWWRCRVNRPREIAVPAGRFAVFKVLCKRYEPGTETVTRTHIWYWAPALGHWVRRVKKYADGRRRELELLRYRRASG